jgi:hypothetical protein
VILDSGYYLIHYIDNVLYFQRTIQDPPLVHPNFNTKLLSHAVLNAKETLKVVLPIYYELLHLFLEDVL